MVNTLPWFHSRQLAQCMSRHLSEAVTQERLSEVEYDWLRQLPDQPSIPSSMRVSLLRNAEPGIFCGLMITRQNPDLPAAYFYSPITGILSFDNRDLLSDALVERTPGAAASGLTPTWLSLTQTPFQRWMKAIIEAQNTRLQIMDAAWRQLPSLADTLDQSLTAALHSALPTLEPIVAKTRKVQCLDSQTKAVVNVQSVLDAALDTLTGREAGSSTQRFIDDQGQPLAAAEQHRYQTTLADTVAQLGDDHGAALRRFWQTPPQRATHSPRDGLSLSLQHSYLSAMLDAQSHVRYSVDQIEMLKSATVAQHPANLRLETLQFAFDGSVRNSSLPWPGTLIISDSADAELGYFIYLTEQGFTHCADSQALAAQLDQLTAEANTSQRVVGGDRSLLVSNPAPVAQRVPVPLNPFDALADDLIELQLRLAASIVADKVSLHPSPVSTVDQGLDLRRLVHPQLHWLGADRRIDSATAPFVDTGAAEPAGNWLVRIKSLQDRLQWQRLQELSLAQGVQAHLAPGLVALQSPFTAEALRLRIAGAPELAAVSLVDYFLERTSGAIVSELTLGDQVLDATGAAIQWPDIIQIEALIKRCRPTLGKAYRSMLNSRMSRVQAPYLGAYSLPGQRRAMREASLRTCLAIAQREGRIDKQLLDLLAKALDRPAASMRGAQDTDVHGIYLQLPEQSTAAPLGSVFVLHRHSAPGGPVLMWCSDQGLRAFDSLAQLKKTIAASVANPLARERWLRDIDPAWAAKLIGQTEAGGAAQVLVKTRGISGDFIAQLDAPECHRQLSMTSLNVQLAITCGFRSVPFQRNVDHAGGDDMLAVDLQRLAVDAANVQLLELMPDWVAKAPAQQLSRYIDILRGCRQTANANSNYLADIPYITDFSRDRLKAAMALAWPGGASNPDRVIIKLTDTSGGGLSPGGGIALGTATSHTKSLTDWAVSQFSGSLSSEMEITLDPPSLVLETPSTHQVRTLVSEADVGGEYRKLLAQKLSPNTAEYKIRRRQFVNALPAHMLLRAIELEMQGQLSSAATNYIARIVEMPEGAVREPLNGQHITLSPLGLIPDTDMAADIACGMYVIAPARPDAGPVLVYTAYADEQPIREYANRAALVQHIKADSKLQELILSRLPEDVHSRYQHDGFNEPHIPWSTEVMDGQRTGRPPAIELLHQPEQGNALYYLFEDNLQLIQLVARQQTMSSGEASWNAFCHVLKLGLEQGAMMLPGAIGSLVAIYQAQQLLTDSAKAIGRHRWGEALADFIAALASVVGARRGFEEFSLEVDDAERIRGNPDSPTRGTYLRSQLTRFEATDVALKDLTYDPLLNMYKSADNASQYAVVDGRVMPVQRDGRGWFIIDPRGDGPAISLDANQKWHTDFDIAAMGAGGSLMDSYENWVTELNLVDVFTPKAQGIAEIRDRYPRHHQMIARAHGHAASCLRNTLENLNQRAPHVPLPAQTTAVLADVFEVDVTPAILHSLRNNCMQLLDELTSDALDPQTSARYWDGLNEAGHENNHAFIWESDPLRRIFLTDQFFRLPNETLMYSSHSRTQDQLYAHHQAASLLHELSHQVLKTVDLAYMDSFMPLHEHFDDLGGRHGQAQVYAHDLQRIRQRALSLSTPPGQLFTRRATLGRRDFLARDGRQRAMVLKLSGASSLAQARVAFYNDPKARARIILGNADSIALLILRLGQEVFPNPAG